MECNKEEAISAKSIADTKFEQQDYAGSKKFALKAQTLCPELDGISEMLVTLDVYLSAERKKNGVIDWYRVLGVDPTAEDEMIKKKYRKLALVLHPDKNRSAGAEDAFKLVSEGWTLLSDKAKRLAYDQITAMAGFQAGDTTPAGGPWPQTDCQWTQADGSSGCGSSAHRSGPSTHIGSPFAYNSSPFTHASGASAHSTLSTQNGGPYKLSTESPVNRKPPAPKASGPRLLKNKVNVKLVSHSSSSPKVDNFWTVCCYCNIHYEYDVMYRKRTLLCIYCKKLFFAIEIPCPAGRGCPMRHCQSNSNSPPPSDGDKGHKNASDSQKSRAGPNVSTSQATPPHPTSASVDKGKNVASDALKAGPGLTDSDLFAQQKNVISDCQNMGTRKNNPSVSTGEPAPSSRSKGIFSDTQNSWEGKGNLHLFTPLLHGQSPVSAGARPSTHTPSSSGRLSRKRKSTGFHMNRKTPDQSTDHRCPSEMPTSLTRLLKLEKAYGRRQVSMMLEEESLAGPTDKAKEEMDETEGSGHSNNNSQGLGKIAKVDQPVASLDDNLHYLGEIMKVPDSNFYNFDRDRTEQSFADNEVWAVYDDNDGMPRHYVIVHRVLSRSPFKLEMSWLNSKTTTELSPLDWVGSGFAKTCGEFRVGKPDICRFVSAFSQKMRWAKGQQGSIVVLPNKGETWAMYRNWSTRWGPETRKDVVHKYDMVVVRKECEAETGRVVVARLEKVPGYRTVFRPSMGEWGIVRIGREEMFRFSHRVPHHELADGETDGAVEGRLELDPAAIPISVFQNMMDGGGVGPRQSGRVSSFGLN